MKQNKKTETKLSILKILLFHSNFHVFRWFQNHFKINKIRIKYRNRLEKGIRPKIVLENVKVSDKTIAIIVPYVWKMELFAKQNLINRKEERNIFNV
jgi:hypothetical protein